MYVGHLGIALALRAHRNAPPLWLLALAVQGPDWVEIALEGIGRGWANPSHSPHAIPLVVAGAVGAGLVAMIVTRRPRAAAIAAIAYLSHLPTDFVTGLKPTWPGHRMVGLQLYGRPLVDFAIEAAVVTLGWYLWRRSLPRVAQSDAGRALAVALLGAMLALQLAADFAMSNGGLLS